MAKSDLQRLFAVACLLCMPASGIHAQSADDVMQVASRAVSFLQPSPSGVVTAAIVYKAGDAASENEMRRIERSLGNGPRFGSMTLRPKRVASHSLSGLRGAKVAFVTRGTNYRQVGAATAAQSILSISFDPVCTRDGHCALSVSSGSRVQIVVSRAATRAAGLSFNSSFLMLIKEI